MAAQTLPLRDIKPIVDVPDHSLWLFAALVLAGILLLGAAAIWLMRRKRTRHDRRRTEALARLESIDYDATKTAVYDFSLLGHFVTTPESAPVFGTLLQELEPYKYKKTVPPLDGELRTKMQAFIKEARRG